MDSLHKIKLNQLEMLVAVADAGSFSAAAAELDCTQSRVSHAIAELERSVGVHLLQRSRAGCTPTDAGHRVLLKARQMLRIADSIIPSVVEEVGIIAQVRLACFRSVGTHLLPRVLEALQRDYPGIHVEIDDACADSTEVNRAMAEGRADVGISCFDLDQRLIAYPFIHDAFMLALPAALKLHAPLSWQQLEGMAFIQAANAGGLWAQEQCRALGFKMEPSRRMASDSGILALVGRGMGFSILPRLAAFPVPEGVSMADLPAPLLRPFSLICDAGTVRLKAVKILIRFLRDKRIIRQTEAFRSGIVGFGY